MPVDAESAVRVSESYQRAIAKWRKTSQMDKVEIVVLIMAVVVFLALVLALLALEV